MDDNQNKEINPKAQSEEKEQDYYTYGSLDVSSEQAKEPKKFSFSQDKKKDQWISKGKRRFSWRPVLLSFFIGMFVLGTFVFIAMQKNWFGEGIGSAETTVNSINHKVNPTKDIVRPNNISQIFADSSPAVVKIETFAATKQNGKDLQDDFYRQFFGDEFGDHEREPDRSPKNDMQESGMGSGFIFDSTGYILTNQHVIEGAEQIKVQVEGHAEPYKAKLLGSSAELDLAVLKIQGKEFPMLKLGNSKQMSMGDWVVAIGNPVGFDHTVTVGVLSSNERQITVPDGNATRKYEHLLQTDASINPGNSGGPLLNLSGEVIGINTAVSTQAQGIGFAIPSHTISEVLNKLKTNTKIPKKPEPFIGATLMDVTPQIAEQLGIDKNMKGSLIREVLFSSPAYKGDLRQYDVISHMDGQAYKTKEALIEAIQKKKIGDKVNFQVIRGGKTLTVTIQVGDKNNFAQK